MVDVSGFVINSDYPLDKLVLVESGSFTIADSTFDSIVLLSHSLPFLPLPILLWSNTPDFTVTNTNMDLAMALSSFGSSVGQQYSAYPVGSSIEVNRTNTSGSSKTVYWRLFAFPPSTASEDSIVPATASEGDDWILNLDFNYMKLVKSTVLTSSSNSYDHNLGYVPVVMAWGDGDASVFAQEISPDPSSASTGVHVTANSVTWLNPSTYAAIEIRIYAETQ